MSTLALTVNQWRLQASQHGINSPAEWLASPHGRTQLEMLQTMPEPVRERLSSDLLWHWPFWARDGQLEPGGDWFIWLIRAGRGFGKTRAAAQTVRSWVDSGVRVVNCAGPTWTDVMDTMVHGTEAAPGLMGVWPEHRKPKLRMSKDDPHLTSWNGAKIRLRAAQSAERFRGPQAEKGWVDEVDSWDPNKMSASDAFSLFELGIRMGDDPAIVATSTPKARGLVGELGARDDCVLTTGSTYDNVANLAPKFLALVRRKYEGTRLGKREIYGDIVDDADGAIVTQAMIDEQRVSDLPEMQRVAIGVDPYGGGGDACGIVAAGRSAFGHGYVLADRTCRLGPEGWGRRVVETALDFDADVIAVEVNYGGDMCIHVVTQAAKAMGVRVRCVKVVSTRAKHLRFDPIGGMYERGEIHHSGTFSQLEEEVCLFTPQGYDGDKSPNDADAAVFAMTELFPIEDVSTWADFYGEEAAA